MHGELQVSFRPVSWLRFIAWPRLPKNGGSCGRLPDYSGGPAPFVGFPILPMMGHRKGSYSAMVDSTTVRTRRREGSYILDPPCHDNYPTA